MFSPQAFINEIDEIAREAGNFGDFVNKCKKTQKHTYFTLWVHNMRFRAFLVMGGPAHFYRVNPIVSKVDQKTNFLFFQIRRLGLK